LLLIPDLPHGVVALSATGKSDYYSSFDVTILGGMTTMAESIGAEVIYAPGMSGVMPDHESGFGNATKVAGEVDVLVVCVGWTAAEVEHEGHDRQDIGLPHPTDDHGQLALLKLVANATLSRGKPVVVVIVSGGPLSIDWAKDTSPSQGAIAVVNNFELGQSAGTALADVLFGEVSPSGVLPYTIFREDYPSRVAMTDMSMLSRQADGTLIGRTYRYFNGYGNSTSGEPLWWFGAGLSYSTWSLSWEGLPPTEDEHRVASITVPLATVAKGGNGLRLNVRVTNTGTYKGAASKVVSAYVQRVDVPGIAAAEAPRKSLFAMAKLRLDPAATAVVELDSAEYAGSCAFCSFQDGHEGEASMVARKGKYRVVLGDGGHTEELSLAVNVV
jgi:hypothetical protein